MGILVRESIWTGVAMVTDGIGLACRFRASPWPFYWKILLCKIDSALGMVGTDLWMLGSRYGIDVTLAGWGGLGGGG